VPSRSTTFALNIRQRQLSLSTRTKEIAHAFQGVVPRALDSLAGCVRVEQLPFTPGDATAGTENELQAVVSGDARAVDLPVAIEESRYYANVARRAAAGEAPRKAVAELRHYLEENRRRVWENSWVRFPLRVLARAARETFRRDLLVSRHDSLGEPRPDAARFTFNKNGEEWARVPVSYLLKIALADAIARLGLAGTETEAAFLRLARHFLNDLVSPETFSFHVVPSRKNQSLGKAVAREAARRFLLTQLLIEWANKSFGLEDAGQRALVFFAPHPPVRQKELNDCISDAFYRELFINPCLSGWDDGAAKCDYMHVAHMVSSRSQLNAIAKLREAGIVTNDLIVLPNTSNVSLSNNGTHLSLGSRKLAALISDTSSGFTSREEKRLGDLVIKICEHFLPLFAGTYTAAPYRLSFSDFHPERVLSFLPHELDYTHLRMLWRHWRRKARLRIFGHALTPYGPQRLDNLLARLFNLRGDFVPDFRLIDYPVAWLSTEASSALDGTPGNVERLKADLENMGVADRRLKLYQPFSLREFAHMNFSGFEGRHYSIFEGFDEDFAPAVELQQLITVVAFKYALSGAYTHARIPDDPSSESERRQAFFGAAIGLPVFYVRAGTPNLFLRRVLSFVRRTRLSRRHTGYIRVPLDEYRRALLETLRHEGAEVVEMLGAESCLSDLAERLANSRESATGKLLRAILARLGEKSAMSVGAREFNIAAEDYYREDLRRRHVSEAIAHLREDLERYCSHPSGGSEATASLSNQMEQGAREFLTQSEESLLDGHLDERQLLRLIRLLLTVIVEDARRAGEVLDSKTARHERTEASVHRAAYACGAY